MTWREKLAYLQELAPTARVVQRDDDTFYVECVHLEIGGDGVLRSPTQLARTRAQAVNECWKEYTAPRGRPLRVVKDARRPTRTEYVWAGDHWACITSAPAP